MASFLTVDLRWWPHPMGLASDVQMCPLIKKRRGCLTLLDGSGNSGRAKTASAGAGLPWKLFTINCLSASLINAC